MALTRRHPGNFFPENHFLFPNVYYFQHASSSREGGENSNDQFRPQRTLEHKQQEAAWRSESKSSSLLNTNAATYVQPLSEIRKHMNTLPV